MFVVGWNREQDDSLRVEPLDEHIRYNLESFCENTSASWAMVGLFETHEEASEYCARLRAIRNERVDKLTNR